jgi:hypothetical protein
MDTDGIFCIDCGADLANFAAAANIPRMPCPSCGSTKRRFAKTLRGTMSVSGQLAAHLRGEKHESFRLNSSARKIASDLSDDGSLTRSVIGIAPKGEEGTERVVKALVERLNNPIRRYGPPQMTTNNAVAEQGFDALCPALDDEIDALRVQIVRADIDEAFWRSFRDGAASWTSSSSDRASRKIWDAISKKTRIPPRDRPQITLALDAFWTPELAFAEVLAAFDRLFGAQVRALGFKSVWIVGATDALVSVLGGTA